MGEWRMRDGGVENEGWGVENESEGWGVETGSGDASETESVTEEESKKGRTSVYASLTPNFRVKKESNNTKLINVTGT